MQGCNVILGSSGWISLREIAVVKGTRKERRVRVCTERSRVRRIMMMVFKGKVATGRNFQSDKERIPSSTIIDEGTSPYAD